MDQIVHKFVDVKGVKLHIAEVGNESSPVVVFVHGFPEIWYTWRHQMMAVAEAGFRAISLDSRGYGLSDPPPDTEKFGFSDIVDDLIAILDSLGIDKIFIVAKDSGARPAYLFTLRYPARVTGVISLGIPHTPFGPPRFLTELPEGFYINRWREPGRAEADFGRFDAKTVVRNIYILFSRYEIPIATENQEIMDIVEPTTPLPPWFTEEDLSAYGTLYQKSGFLNPLKVPYRSIEEEYDIEDPVIKNPMLLVVGEKDYFLKFPGMEDFIKSGMVKHFASDLEVEYVPEGSHFVQEQFPDKIFIVSKDSGTRPAYLFTLRYPTRVTGVISLGIPHTPLGPPTFLTQLPEGFYINRWREPGRAEADFGRLDAKTVVRNIYILFSGYELPIATENQEIMDIVDPSTPLPPWFTEEDLSAYGTLYQKSGFLNSLKVPYRSIEEEYDIEDHVIKNPMLLIVGEKDYFLKFPGVEDLIKSGTVKHFASDLEIEYVPEGSHFVQEQFPDKVNPMIIAFLRKHC